MVTREENELLCRVTGDAPMGRMLRQHYWLPAVLSVRVRKGEAPVRVKLFGRNFVAFGGRTEPSASSTKLARTEVPLLRSRVSVIVR